MSFDFTKCLAFIETTGKKLYHPSFKVIAEDYEITYKLLVYILQDNAGAEKYNLSFRKGILFPVPLVVAKPH